MVHCVAVSNAQELPRIRNFTPSEYHAQPQNWSLCQNPEAGWIYIANNEGLLEFDGIHWQNYHLPDQQTVRALAIDSRQNIYGGGFAEFGYWKPQLNGLLEYQSLSRNVQAPHLAKEEIWHILSRPNEVLFQSFSTIYRYDFQKVHVINPPGAIMFLQDVNGQLYFQIIGRGIFELLPDNTFKLLNGTEPISDKIVQFIVSNGQQGLLIGTTTDGIFQYQNQNIEPWNHPLNADFKRFQLNKALRMRNGNLAIGTIRNGLYLLDSKNTLQYHLNRESGLQNNTVLALFEDRDQNLWLGLDRGVDFIELNAPLTYYTDQSGKLGAVYTSALFQNQLYVGTNQGLFVKNSHAPGAAFALADGAQGQVWQLQVFDNQLICGHNSGTFLITKKGISKISDITGGWCTIPIPGRKDVLIQSTYTGLVVYQKSLDGNWKFVKRISGFEEPLRKIIFDSKGYLWGAHPNRGLFRLRISEDLSQITELKQFTKEDGLNWDVKIDLLQLDSLFIVNPEGSPMAVQIVENQVTFGKTPPGLQTGKLLPGMNADFFQVFNAQVVLHRDNKPYRFPLHLVDGYENIVGLNAQYYLFCMENGYALLDLSKLNSEGPPVSTPPRVRRVQTGETFANLDNTQISDPIPYGKNDLHFWFSSASFSYPPRLSWKMKGVSEEWSEWHSTGEKEFTNLPSGKYTFWLRDENTGQEIPFQFSVQAPWYGSVYAWVVYLILGILVFVLFEKVNLNRLAKQRLELEHEKQRDLSQQRIETERELLRLELGNKSRELSNAALGLIRKNEILLKIKDDLLASKGDARALDKLARLIDSHVESDHDWEVFENSFNQVHDDFFKRLMQQFADLTPGDLRLAAYLKMNLASKEIAPLLNISVRGVENKRYRLRKKLGLPEEANLTEFMMNF